MPTLNMNFTLSLARTLEIGWLTGHFLEDARRSALDVKRTPD